MVSENRIITFSDAEVLEALVAYCVKTGRLETKARIASPLVTNEGEIKLSFDSVPAGRPITLHEREILSAIILYCNARGVPIPQRARKTIRVSRDTFSMHLDTLNP